MTLALDVTQGVPCGRFVLTEDVQRLEHHKIFAFCLSDAHLNTCLAAFLEPSDKGARKTTESKMLADDKVCVPQGESFFLTLFGGII